MELCITEKTTEFAKEWTHGTTSEMKGMLGYVRCVVADPRKDRTSYVGEGKETRHQHKYVCCKKILDNYIVANQRTNSN